MRVWGIGLGVSVRVGCGVRVWRLACVVRVSRVGLGWRVRVWVAVRVWVRVRVPG